MTIGRELNEKSAKIVHTVIVYQIIAGRGLVTIAFQLLDAYKVKQIIAYWCACVLGLYQRQWRWVKISR